VILFIVLLPLLAAAIAGLSNKAFGNAFPKLVTTAALFVACGMSWSIFLHYLGGADATVTPVFEWMKSGDLDIAWALRVDALTAVMLVVITSVSALVHLYSWGYMDEDPDQPRFFAYLSLFTFAMLMLVTANNLVQMFFGWEGVGLASYLLIGFWFRKPSANAAAIKAFVVNRVGDLGFMLGIFGIYLVFGTVSIPEILAAAPHMAGSTIGFLGQRVDTLTLLCLLLFVGACGKSAQLGLHTWLPDAMAACRDDGGRRDLLLRRDDRAGADRHQARHRLFDLLAARLHVLRGRRRRVQCRDVPPLHPRLLQGAAVSRCRLGDPRHAP
jgi:NADH-quinone oxidoreductase subunit L